MKRIVLCLALAGCASGAPSPASGGTAPDAPVRTLEGGPAQLSSLWSGRPVLLVFMTAWCQTCRGEVPELNDYSRGHAVAAISTGDRPEAVQRFRSQTRAAYPFYLDGGEAARAYGVTSTPTCVLVDADGTIRYRGAHLPGRQP